MVEHKRVGTDVAVSDEMQLVTMEVDAQQFGIPILKVQDIVEPERITPVPLAPGSIAGVLNLRGRIVTVIDMRRVLDAKGDFADGQSLMSVTVDHNGDLYTLLVDSIGDVRSFATKTYEKPPATLDENLRRVCSGVLRLEGTLLVVLDVDKILSEETLARTPPATRRRLRLKAEKKLNGKAAGAGDGEGAVDRAVAALRASLAGDPVLKDLVKTDSPDVLRVKAKTAMAAAFRDVGFEEAYLSLIRRPGAGDDHFVALATAFHGALTEAGAPADVVDRAMAAVDRIRVAHLDG